MPGFRSKVDNSASAGFVFRSELPVASRTAMLPFMPKALKVKRSLDANIEAAGGLLSYELIADFKTKTFRVASSWSDQQAFSAWVGAEPHRSVMASLRPKVHGGTFETQVIDRPG
jgi:heme-degrading monooxygenase HmoA